MNHRSHAPDKVWVIDDDRSIRWVLEKALKGARMDVTTFEDGESALAALAGNPPDAVVTDVRMPGIDGLSLLERIHSKEPDLPVIVITAHSDLDSAVSAYESGAFEYLPKPFDIDEAVTVVEKACKHRHQQSESAQDNTADMPEIIGAAPSMQEVFRAIGRLARSNITVLINGESGTGKELVAKALHRHSPRAGKPFIALNMAAIPKELMESELFGHEKGAFTGANNLRQGRFEQANEGTLFLDEIGDMPAELQTRLLRVLADGVFYRVGGHSPIKVDVRIIAATHQDLEDRVKQGMFREDLFHRLNVIRMRLPPLRERREDIPALAKFFLARAGEELNVEPKSLTAPAEQALMAFDWLGNVRQLENTCRWITVMATGRDVGPDELPEELRGENAAGGSANTDWKSNLRQWTVGKLMAGDHGLLDQVIPDVERILLEAALERTAGRRQDAARLLGWGRNTLTRKLKELNME
ncbi:MAG: nitrogen regulation protein NR(I) [Gammaproteobacteria bacterium]